MSVETEGNRRIRCLVELDENDNVVVTRFAGCAPDDARDLCRLVAIGDNSVHYRATT